MNLEKEQKKWIAIYTKPHHEKTVKNQLSKKGFEIYLPLLRKRKKWSDRKKWIESPLFKSYIFVKTEIKNSLFILQTLGVVKIIKFGNKIALIQNETIQAIKLMIKGGYVPETINYFVKGEIVEIKNGPLKGLVGEVTRVNNSDRLLVRIDAIQQSISVQIDRSFLKYE